MKKILFLIMLIAVNTCFIYPKTGYKSSSDVAKSEAAGRKYQKEKGFNYLP